MAASIDTSEIPVALVLAGVTFLVFRATLGNGFVDWDDPSTAQNPNCLGLNATQLKWMFSTFFWGHYQPLVWLSYAFDYEWSRWWSGDGPKAFTSHFTSNLLHALNAALLYLLTLRLLTGTGAAEPRKTLLKDAHEARPHDSHRERRAWPVHAAAALAALLFALHPLRVEPVAWATGRGDVLVTSFLLLTVLAYLRAAEAGSGSRYMISLVLACLLFIAALLTRAMAVTMPVVLLLLDWYPLGRLGRSPKEWIAPQHRRVWFEKIPFFVLATAAAVIAPMAKASVKATVGLMEHAPAQRIAQACYGLVFYLWKTLVPRNLSPIYELRMPIDIAEPRYIAAMLLVLIGAAAIAFMIFKGRGSALVCAACAYCLLALPILGLVQSGNQEVADRYCYLPSLPMAVLVAAGLRWAWENVRSPIWMKLGLAISGGGAAALLIVLTLRQSTVWHDASSLWNHAALVSPDSSIALNGYGWTLVEQKRYEEAVPCLQRAIELQPANEKAHHNLWRALSDLGNTDELLQAYRNSIRVFPAFFDAHYNLGNELLARTQNAEAAQEYRIALALNPGDSRAHTNLGKALLRLGDKTEALQQYEAAVKADSRNVNARHGLALLLHEQDREAEAIEHLRAALEINPTYEPARLLLKEWTNASDAGK